MKKRMQKQQHYPRILTGNIQLGPYPMEKLTRVDKPTTKITNNIKRFDEREIGFARARRGDFGSSVVRESSRFVAKDPIGISLMRSFMSFPPVDVGLDPMMPSLSGGPRVLPHMPPMAEGKPSMKPPSPENIEVMRRPILSPVSEVTPHRAPIPQEPVVLSRHIKSLGYFLRSDIIGICKLPQWAVYSHDMLGNTVECNYKNSICIVVDQGYETMHGSTGDDWISGSQSGLSYSTSAFIAFIMANYIRKLGYPARVNHAQNYQVIVPPLLLLAGIGEVCRAGIVLNPFVGTRFKAAVVTTDMPLEPDKPVDFGLQEFCAKCKKCAIECPSKSISMGDKVMRNGYENWEFEAERCTKFRIANQNGSACGRCIKVCPWNKPQGWIHDVVRWMVQHTPFMDSFFIKMDDVWGYGKQEIEDKWWFDLEDIDGVLQIPRKSQDYNLTATRFVR